MYLSRLVIRNYRSIENLDLKFSRGKNIIVGKNNAGKSNIIRAIDVVLGENSPTYNKSENVTISDFFTKKSEIDGQVSVANDLYISCFLTRGDEEDLDFEAIDKCSGYYKMMKEENRYEDKRIQLNDFSSEEELSSIFSYNIDIQSPTDTGFVPNKFWVDSKLRNQRRFRTELVDKYEFVLVFHAHREDDVVYKEIRFIYRESDNEDWILCFSAPIRNELLQSAIIPAFRDPDSQLRLASWTWYGKLMRHMTAGDHRDLEEAFNRVVEVSNQIFAAVQEKVKNESLNVAFPGAEIFFQFSDEKRQDIYKSTKIYIDDGIKTVLSDKGAGIQSATIIGLFNFYTKTVNTKTSALLCVEEPELYLHPHARRVISDRLDEFVKDEDGEEKHQVILTTHSSEFVRTTDESLNIILINKNESGTKGTKVQIKELKNLLLDERYTESFFADKVILCEGLDGYILRWVSDEFFPEEMNSKNISILNVASKDNFPKFVELILDAGIPCYIFADFDFLLRDEKDESKQYNKTHKSIGHLGRGFFSQKQIFGNDFQSHVDAIKEFRDSLKNEDEEVFYKAKKIEDLPDTSSAIELLADLRAHGIGILDGEIEDLSKKHDILKSGEIKLSFNKIFQLSREINNGVKISEIIETQQIREFLSSVINS